MKSLLIGLVLALFIGAAFVTPAKAACYNAAITGNVCTGSIACGDGVTCCDLTSECPGPTNSSGTDPLCGVGNKGVNTALGCLSAGSPTLLITEVLNWAVVVGIGVAFLMIIFAGFQITTAAGDPKRVKAGQELITSALAGLILIIFSIVLLNFIGVQLLHLPGFVGNQSL